MLRICRVVFLVSLYLLKNGASKSGKKPGFEVILENIQDCKAPSPPYVNVSTIITEYRIHVVNGTRYLSGNTTIIEPTPFQNFSARTYAVDRAGNRVVKTQISEVSCRNFFVKVIIMFVNMTISSKKCLLNQGFSRYEDIDLNKVMHAIPTWHAPGDLYHELQLVVDGATEFCTEIKVKVIKI